MHCIYPRAQPEQTFTDVVGVTGDVGITYIVGVKPELSDH